jgi:malonyl CoA-acyl carrier protein transacylase
MEHRLEEKYLGEAQYWWAFSCLALARRRNAADFRAELLRRSSDSYPAPEQVENIIDEALTHLAEVLNAALAERQSRQIAASGWDRHLLALSTSPESA